MDTEKEYVLETLRIINIFISSQSFKIGGDVHSRDEETELKYRLMISKGIIEEYL